MAARGISSRQPRDSARFWAKKARMLRDAALGAGFNTNALVLTAEMVRTWARAGESTSVHVADQPSQPMAAETVRRADAGSNVW